MRNDILFELGIVLFLSFFTALVMKKLHQSVITGYIITGLVIGPNVLGLIKDPSLIHHFSELGIVFLIFFLGLEFSFGKLKKVSRSILFIGTFKVLLSLAVGVLLGNLVEFIAKEKFFLAGIVALSSSGVVAKLLFDLKRTASKESEVLMGVMVYEDFIAIILLGILSSLAASNTFQFGVIILSVAKSIAFYVVFIGLGLLTMNKFIDKILMRIDSQELFTALMLGLILLIGSLAVKIGLASAAGSFLLGMMINCYDVEERLHRAISAFKDIFLIVFFISFGMLLDPRQIPSILWIVFIILPVSILAEISFTSAASFLSGFYGHRALTIGTSTIARGEYSLIYAALGYSLGAISNQLYQFTGVYVFCMTLLAPVAMKNSGRLYPLVSKGIPPFIKYSLKLVSLTLRPILLSDDSGPKVEGKFIFMGVFLLYLLILFVAFIARNLAVILPLCLAGILVIVLLRQWFVNTIKNTEKRFNYTEIHEGPYNLDMIAHAIANLFSGFLMIILLGASFWNYGHLILILLLILFVAYLLGISFYVYRRSQVTGARP
jgi:CPA2 family monovalent cation:H+ antiporter-2